MALIPKTARRLPEFALDDGQWEALGIPVDLVCFFRAHQSGQIIALYPGPAGALESTVESAAWDELEVVNPELGEWDLEVQTLLVHRVRGERRCYQLPIDRAFELVGLFRTHWQGLTGGQDVWDRLIAYLAALENTSFHSTDIGF